MPDSPPSVTKGKRTRTFTGCLTCRRRKVKCPDSTHPCQACSRLRLECVSPFSSNLRSATINNRPRAQQRGSNENNSQSPEAPRHVAKLLTPSASYFDPASHSGDSSSPVTTQFNLEALTEWDAALGHSDAVCQARVPFLNQSAFLDCLPIEGDVSDVFSFSAPDHSQAPQPSWSPNQTGTSLEAVSDVVSVGTDTTSTHRSVPLSVTQTSGIQEHELDQILYQDLMGMDLDLFSPEAKPFTINHFKTYMASTLSVKDVKWNIFTYFLDADQRHGQSPIKSSIIAMAAAHQGLKDQGVVNEYLAHYAHASADLSRLFASLQVNDQLPTDQMEMILATVYFLSHCDLIACNAPGLAERLDGIRNIIQGKWHLLSVNLSGVSARLILWLGYLDVRRSLLLHDGNTSTELLLAIIGKRNGLPQLYLSSRLYLKEAFGDTYPSSELRNDMIQDPVNLKFSEAMTVLGRIVHEARGTSSESRGSIPQPDEELRHLYSQLMGLERECDMALQGFNSGGSVTVTRTSYHWLNLKAMNNSGFILLNRMRNPEVRADPEAQRAAYEILKIMMKLRKANKLHNPHSVFSILPIFLAGIETIDEVHQDWVKRFLEDASDWGLHVQQASRLMQRVLETQNQTGCRLALRDIANLGTTQLIL